MFRDDIEDLPKHIPNSYRVQTVLAEQIKLLDRNLPLTLMGALFTSICFYISMFLTYDLNTNQKILNTMWLIYHAVVVGLWLLGWQQIFKKPDVINIKLLKNIFRIFTSLFVAAIVLGMPLFIRLLQNTPLDKLNSAKAMVAMWIFFHVVLLLVCWVNWTKIKAAITFVKHEESQSTTANHANYLAHYAAYSISLIAALALGCLWALAVGKAFTTNLQNYTQIIVIMGLQFGIMSGAISSVAMFLRVYMAFAVPSIVIWVFILFYFHDIGLTILAVAVIVLVLFDIFFARHNWRNTLSAILINLENKNLVAQLQIKTRQVEEASKAKTQLLASASHDLRQPVHALSLFIEALGDTDLTEHQEQIVNYAKSASHSSREMLNTILDYAHLESGQITANFVATDLNLIIQNLVDEFSIQAGQKSLYLNFESTSTWAMTDPTMLALILRNLISNAIRYTDKGGVLIEVRTLPMQDKAVLIEQCQISVQDTGSGMTSLEIGQVFESFYQLERNSISSQGLGLGLAIVKGMTRLLQTDVHVESDMDKGSVFSVVLPISTIKSSHNTKNLVMVNALEGKKVLIVDDDHSVLKSMQLLLTTWGCQVITMQTLQQAVDAFIEHRPDIVVTDFRLSNAETGEDVILAIKNTSKEKLKAQFVILTADTSPKLFKVTQRINPTILHKPIDPTMLRQCLHDIAAKQEGLD